MTRVTPQISLRLHHPEESFPPPGTLYRILTVLRTPYKTLESSTQVRRQSPGFWGKIW